MESFAGHLAFLVPLSSFKQVTRLATVYQVSLHDLFCWWLVLNPLNAKEALHAEHELDFLNPIINNTPEVGE